MTTTPGLPAEGRDCETPPGHADLPLLQADTSALCYDGQYFFDADHPYGGVSDRGTYTGDLGSVSNYDDGTGPEGTDGSGAGPVPHGRE